MDTRGQTCLGQEHGAELAGADQPGDADEQHEGKQQKQSGNEGRGEEDGGARADNSAAGDSARDPDYIEGASIGTKSLVDSFFVRDGSLAAAFEAVLPQAGIDGEALVGIVGVDLIDTPYINMESAINHPCQSLGDWKTLDDLGIPSGGGKFVLAWTWHPEPMPLAVPAATLHMAALRGMDVTVLRPEWFSLPATLMSKAQNAAAANGGSVTETRDVDEAMQDAHVLYVNSWAAEQYYGDKYAEDKFKLDLRDWCVDESWFRAASGDCRFMHCLPVRRGVTVKDEILDGPRSVVIDEAHNRMLVQMAVLHEMLASA